jgi:hypothetical protein
VSSIWLWTSSITSDLSKKECFSKQNINYNRQRKAKNVIEG